MSPAFDLSRLRFVCMNCPAVATTRLARFEMDADAVLVWVESHGEHVLGLIDGRALRQVRAQSDEGPLSLPMQSVRAIDANEIAQRRNDIEAHLMRLAAEIDVYDRFLAEGGPKTAPSVEPGS